MIEENYYWQKHPLTLHDDIHIHECIDRLLWATWSLHVFLAPYFVQILVDVLHSLIGWKNTWMIILMHIIYLWIRIVGHGILTYVIGSDLIGHLKLVCTWKMVVYSLGGISTFMISWWGTSLLYILIMFLYTFMTYIMHSWCLEECIQENGIQKFSFQMVWVGEHS